MQISAQFLGRKELLRRVFWAGSLLNSYLSTHLIGLDDTDSSGHICGSNRDGYVPNSFSNEHFCSHDNKGTEQTQDEDFID